MSSILGRLKSSFFPSQVKEGVTNEASNERAKPLHDLVAKLKTGTSLNEIEVHSLKSLCLIRHTTVLCSRFFRIDSPSLQRINKLFRCVLTINSPRRDQVLKEIETDLAHIPHTSTFEETERIREVVSPQARDSIEGSFPLTASTVRNDESERSTSNATQVALVFDSNSRVLNLIERELLIPGRTKQEIALLAETMLELDQIKKDMGYMACLFKKLKVGINLNKEEIKFLERLRPTREARKTRAGSESSQKITALLNAVLAASFYNPFPVRQRMSPTNTCRTPLCERKASITQEDSDVLKEIEEELSNPNRTKQEVSFLAQLLFTLNYKLPQVDSSQPTIDQVQQIIDQFAETHSRCPSHKDLCELIQLLNENSPPQKTKRDAYVAKLNYMDQRANRAERKPVTICYGSDGYLEIKTQDLCPVDFSLRQQLTAEARKEIKEIYCQLIDLPGYRLPLNTLGEFLEFVAYVRSQQNTPSPQRLNRIQGSYQPNLARTFYKYQSGNPLSLATAFHQKLAEKNIKAQLIFQPAEPELAQVVDHTYVLILFTDENGNSRAMKFNYLFTQDQGDGIEEFLIDSQESGLKNLFKGHPDRIDNPSKVANSYLGKQFKLVCQSLNFATLEVDLLKGNINLYLNPDWENGLRDLPLNKEGQMLIDLKDLAYPENKGTYYVNDQETELSHSQALEMLLKKARLAMPIPNTMQYDLITLAQYLPDLMPQEVALSPTTTTHAVLPSPELPFSPKHTESFPTDLRRASFPQPEPANSQVVTKPSFVDFSCTQDPTQPVPGCFEKPIGLAKEADS